MDIQKQIQINMLVCQQLAMTTAVFMSWAVLGVGR